MRVRGNGTCFDAMKPSLSSARAHRIDVPGVNGVMRAGLLLEWPDGPVKWTEGSPLPGWSRESFEEVVRAFRSSAHPAPAALRAALDSADSTWPRLRSRVSVNALLTGDFTDMRGKIIRAAGEGCCCAKIKTTDACSAADLVSRLSEAAGGGVRFRIDPNRAWSLDEALHAAHSLKDLPVDYLEEPLANPAQLLEFMRRSPVPVALDETLRDLSPADVSLYREAVALVLKPTLAGGFDVCREFAQRASDMGIPSVVSASYESGVGIFHLARFAASLPLPTAAGLDTYATCFPDVLSTRLNMKGFVFDVTQPLPDVDRSRLSPLD